ncbi:kynurenine aminotransferase-like isoform X1 [Atheta coriaria]|uniref:kynurenine aminotransferase-like isoform X1 n=2 Tax=Dalotia coriaria TaxID=877792 RepID=UPI0031F3E847
MLSTRLISSILKLTSAAIRRGGKRAMSDACAAEAACAMEEKFQLPKRYGKGEKSVWVEFIEVAAKTKALNLGQGFPDYPPPKYVTEALQSVACSDNHLLNQYTRGYGHPRLVNALAKLYSKLLNRELDPLTNVLITIGAYEALFTAINGHVSKGDEVIIIEPFFDCYEPMVRAAGGIPRFIPLRMLSEPEGMITSSDFCLDPDELEGLFNDKTKLIIVNTPNNPFGKVFSYEELEMIANLCKKWNVICISDEVYEWMVYKPKCHIRMATLPDMWERTITIGSAGKTFSVTGWKTGWAYGPSNILENMRVVHQNVVYVHSTPIQEAIALGFEKEIDRMDNDPENCFFYTIVDELTPKRDFMCKFLAESGMKPVCPEGGYFILADWSPIESQMDLSTEKDKFKDYRMAKWMAKNVGLLGIPPTAFYSAHKELAEKYIRYCFIKEDKNSSKQLKF